MFETSFQHSSSTPIPSDVSISHGLSILHDFETVVLLSPDCFGCRRLSPSEVPNGKSSDCNQGQDQTQHWEVSDTLPFIPKRLWSGGVKYTADFLPQPDGCIITVYAPGGFTSVNHWRLLHENKTKSRGHLRRPSLQRNSSKDLSNVGAQEGWHVQIVSDAKCSRTFAGFVKGFLKNNQVKLQEGFIEKLRERSELVVAGGGERTRRPAVGRRKSSVM